MTTVEQGLSHPSAVLAQLTETLKTRPISQALKKFAAVLREKFDQYNWVGIYLVKEGKLVLEAYAGDAETEHANIPIGEGICGYAAKVGETVIVGDVSKDPRYLMCFPSTRSEIVVPIKGETEIIGEIDIDSDKLSAFSRTDEDFLEAAAKELANFLRPQK